MSAPGTDAARTRIGSSPEDTARIELRGLDLVSDVLGQMSFSEAFYLAITGRPARETERQVVDAALVVLMDHGLTPTALVSRFVADSLPDQPQVAIGAGLMLIGDRFVGTLVGAATYLREGIDAGADWPAAFVAEARAAKRRLPGFGHPHFHPVDPRSARLFAIARKAGVAGRYIARIEAVHAELERQSSRRVTLNVTGALGAILSEIDVPLGALRGLAVVSRAAGLTAHVAEEAEGPSVARYLTAAAAAIPYEP